MKSIVRQIGLLCFLSSSLSLHADEFTWGHSGLGNWTSLANWSPNGQPNTGSLVTITNGGTARLNSGDAGVYQTLRLGTFFGGSGHVNITAGALLSGQGAVLGQAAGSSGSVTVTNATWTNSAWLEVGGAGTGSLFINGGSVSTGSVDIGTGAGSSGTVTVASGTWINSGGIDLGYSGTGFLNISGESLVSGTAGYIGRQAGSTGSATISGGTWVTSGNLSVGNSGAGNLLVSGGLVRVSGTAFTGFENGGSGSIQLQGGTLSARRLAKGSGSATLSLNGGILQARADEADFLSGYGAGDVTVAAGGAFFDSNGYAVGISTTLSGIGSLTKLGQGTLTLTGSNNYSGGTTIRSGTLSVTTGGWISNTGTSTVVGSSSGDNASLLINGGVVSNFWGTIGNAAGSLGRVTVTSGTWANSGGIYLGASGNGQLLVDGGRVSNTLGYIGYNANGTGSATVTSGTWSNSSSLLVGFQGNGSLLINGGYVSSFLGVIGSQSASNGNAEVTSGVWDIATELYLGRSGTGTLLVNGGLIANATAIIGDNPGASGSATVTSGTWGTFGNLNVGYDGTGTILINGGFVGVTGTVITGYSSSASGSIQLRGGVLSAARLGENNGSGKISLDGGVLQARSNQSNFLVGYEAGDVTIDSGGAFIDSNGYAIGISTALSGTGHLTKVGTGILTLGGANSYAGGTTVSLGTLVAAHAQAMGTGDVTIEGGGFHIAADVDINNAIVLAGGQFSRDISGDLAGAVDATSSLGGIDTTARILAGTTGAITLVTSFTHDEDAFSDVYHLEGTGTAAFVLELSFSSLQTGLYVGWREDGEWLNAVAGNTGNTATGGMLGFSGSFTEFQSIYGTDLASYMGAYGSETIGGITSVWAVINHNSEFAAIPEPSTLLLLPAGLLVLLNSRRRR